MSVGRLQLLFSSWHFLRLPKSICITGHVPYIREEQELQDLYSLQPIKKDSRVREFSAASLGISQEIRSKDGLVCKPNLLQETGLVVQSSKVELGDPGRTEIHMEVLSLRKPGIQVFFLCLLWAGVLFSPFF